MTTSPALRKGWCPGARRPMQAKDGLIVRLKITGARLSTARLRALAQAARAYGNGIFDLTGRANLQLRGVRADTHGLLIETLDRLDLVDENAAAEAVRNILLSPLSGIEDNQDGFDAAKALEQMLARDRDLYALPAKFGFLIDDGNGLSLASVPADIRFDWTGGVRSFAIGIGGRASEAISLGRCHASEIPAVAASLARAFLELAAEASKQPQRMCELIESCGADAVATAAGLRPALARMPSASQAPCPVGLLPLESNYCFGAGVAFGHLSATMIEAVAHAADTFGRGEIRLTPWHALIFPYVRPAETEKLSASLAASGFIVDHEDSRLAVTACRGAVTCSHGTTDTRADAFALMYDARKLYKTGAALHISGCSKGCGHRASTPITLVARAGLYDFTVDTAALGTPVCSKQQLSMTQVRERLEETARRVPQSPELARQ